MTEKVISLLKKEYPDAKYYLNFSNSLELMIAGILSAQVRDVVVNNSTPALFKKYKTAKAYAKASEKDILKYISKVTFANNKAKHVKNACQALVDNHKGQVPKTMKELEELPGIGHKTANVIMQNAYGIIEGIIVDTHVIRLSNRLGWTKNKNPDKIEKDLMEKVDRKYWKTIPHLLKNHGRAKCVSIPKCSECILDKLCPKIGVTKKQ